MSYQPSYHPASRTSSLAIVSLVFGILTWCVLPFLGAIVAIVCGHLARSEIRRASAAPVEGDGMAVAGLVLGYLHLVLVTAALTVVVGLLFFGLVTFSHWPWQWH
jgi:thiol:disulfide interchange protein